MTAGRHRLVALAVTLAPARAVRLLGRLGGPGGSEAARLAGALATAPRRARLAALAASLAEPGTQARPSASPPCPRHPLLRRLELERRGRTAADRLAVRAAADLLACSI